LEGAEEGLVMSQTAAKSAEVGRLKNQMMQVMGITDEKEFQRVAREYCKDMAADLTLPAFHRICTKLSKVIETRKDWFEKLKSADRVGAVLKFAMDDEEIVDAFKNSMEMEDKDGIVDADLSTNKRNAGNASFQKKREQEALILYSEAVMAGRGGTDEGRKDAALALANRSAVWLRLGKHAECLDDVEAAQIFGYPGNMLYKLVERQGKCLAAIGRMEEARVAYNRVSLLLKQSGLEADKQAIWAKDVEKELEKLKTAKPVLQSEKSELKMGSLNPRIPQFSSAVELAYSPLVGRHAVAARDISPGEFLMLDTATTSRLLCGTRLTNCAHCTARLGPTTGKPSPISQTSRFCSSSCLRAAMATYHPVEAQIGIEKLFWNRKENVFEETSGNLFLTYRTITQKPLKYFMDWSTFTTEVSEEFGMEWDKEDDKMGWQDYRNIVNLVAHRDRQTTNEMLGVAITTVILIVLLRHGGYMGTKETPYGATLSQKEAHLANIIVHIQEGMRYNLHTTNEVECSNMSALSMPKTKETGSALFPTLLLLNHSCDTNTLRLNTGGNQVMLVAKRSIKCGEEITDNYGIHHLSLPVDERQEKLMQGFAFCCWCQACQKDYPRMKSLKSQLPEEVEDKYDVMRDQIKEMFRKGQLTECYNISIQMIQLLEKAVIPPPHRNYEMASLGLLSCLWALYGNKGEGRK